MFSDVMRQKTKFLEKFKSIYIYKEFLKNIFSICYRGLYLGNK